MSKDCWKGCFISEGLKDPSILGQIMPSNNYQEIPRMA